MVDANQRASSAKYRCKHGQIERDKHGQTLLPTGMACYERAALLFRIAVALLTRTFFQPDEYYQSLEPAHHIVFGYGALTWEWFTSIRSVLYPALNIPVYALLKVTDLAETPVLGDWLLVGRSPTLLFSARSQYCG